MCHDLPAIVQKLGIEQGLIPYHTKQNQCLDMEITLVVNKASDVVLHSGTKVVICEDKRAPIMKLKLIVIGPC